MSHVLVRWLNTGRRSLFDVISVRDIVDIKIGAKILQNSKDPSIFTDVEVRWGGDKHPAKIVAVGTAAKMDKRCRLEIKEATSDGACRSSDQMGACDQCASLNEVNSGLKRRVEELEEDSKRFKATVDYLTLQRNGFEDLSTAVGQLRQMCQELLDAKNREDAGNRDEPEDNEGVSFGGRLVTERNLCLLDFGATKTPSAYAREVMKMVFTNDEMAGTSLTGKQSNAHKDKDAKPQLDPAVVNAVLKYTMQKFDLKKATTLRTSLASMLNKVKPSL